MASLDDSSIIADFKKRIKVCLENLKKDYKNLCKARGGDSEKEFIGIIHEINQNYQLTKNKEYLRLKDSTMIDYSNIVINSKNTRTNYGR